MAIMMLQKKDYYLLIAGYLSAGLLIALGLWQLQRANDKWPLLTLTAPSSLVKLSSLTPKNIQIHDYALWDLTLDKKRYILQNNIIVNHIRGYNVFGLGKHPKTGAHIIIGLGWVAEKQQAAALLKNTKQQVIFTQPKGFLLELNSHANSTNWPFEINYIDTKHLEQHSQLPIFHLVASASNTQHYQLLHNNDSTSQALARHLSYSVQFILLALLCIYYSHTLRK